MSVLTPLPLRSLSVQARRLLGDDIDKAYCFNLPLRRRFRRITHREGVLIHGPAGWGEISPFWDYGPRTSLRWALAGIEAATRPAPTPLTDRVPVNVTVPIVDPDTARSIIKNAGGCTTAKIKVADPGVHIDADEARCAAVRETFDDMGVDNAAIRIDVNGAWDVDTAAKLIPLLNKAAMGRAGIGLQYVEQPCMDVHDLATLRRRLDVPIAADESIRLAQRPSDVIDLQAADYLVVKVHPFGGIEAITRFLEESNLPVVVSSAVDSSVGLQRGALLAASLSDSPLACGLGTGLMFDTDIARPRIIPEGGTIPVTPVDVNEALADDTTSDIALRWAHRLDTIGRAADDSRSTSVAPCSPRDESDATLAARATIMALISAGVRDIVMCPGSRNAPLTYAAKQAQDAGLVRVHVRIDERSAAFFALGLSKAGRAHVETEQSRALSGCVPVALMMTSGTAVMNVHPALAEASHSWVPLIVVSADRPASMRGTAANQTTDQVTIFGSQVRFSADIPDHLTDMASWDETMAHTVGHAVAYARGDVDRDPGPVHINMQFSAPLVERKRWAPSAIDLGHMRRLSQAIPDLSSTSPALGHAHERGAWSRTSGLARVGDKRRYHQLRDAINPALTTVIVACDPGAPNRRAAQRVLDLAQGTGWLVCSEPSSGIRAGQTTPCDYQAGLLHLQAVAADKGLVPAGNSSDTPSLDGIEQVIVLGHPTLSRPITRLVESPLVRQIRISPWGTVCDTGHVADAIVENLPDDDQVSAIIDDVTKYRQHGSDVGKRQQLINDTVMEAASSSEHFMFFGDVVRALWDRELNHDTSIPLIVGSSNTIRILDRCAQPADSVNDLPFVLTNRGLAGIDGTIATALGVASGLRRPVRAIMGDITFFHDSSSLLRGVYEEQLSAQIFVLNDHGGAIFRDLEHGEPHRRHAFDRFFLTPQDASIENIARGFHATYQHVTSLDDLDHIMSQPIDVGIHVIEISSL